ncbi:dnaJ homolog subfamily C member 27-like [Liolophura sinensis]|uniref:dnaJ homolog subfamily C member 27-like n=1 Tax=Liolophura sinensis TaxID=3198878 RepID=UPI003157FBE5
MDREPGHLTKNPHDAVDALVWAKLVGVGNSNTGKTCIIKHFCESKFSAGYQATVGVDYGFKIHRTNNMDLRVHLWDLSGNPEYIDVRNELYDNADAIFLVYDITNTASFQSLDVWLREIHKYCNSHPEIVLVANKVDVKAKRAVSIAEGRKWAKDHKLAYYETSPASGEGIEKLFGDLLQHIIEKKKIKSHS